MSGSFPADLEEMRQVYVRSQEANKHAMDHVELVQVEKLKDQIDEAKCRKAYIEAYVETGTFYYTPLVCRSKEQAHGNEPSEWLKQTFARRHTHHTLFSYEDRGDTRDKHRWYVELKETKFQ